MLCLQAFVLMPQGFVRDLLSGVRGKSLQDDAGVLSTPQEGPQECHLKTHLEVSPTQPSVAGIHSVNISEHPFSEDPNPCKFSSYLFIK